MFRSTVARLLAPLLTLCLVLLAACAGDGMGPRARFTRFDVRHTQVFYDAACPPERADCQDRSATGTEKARMRTLINQNFQNLQNPTCAGLKERALNAVDYNQVRVFSDPMDQWDDWDVHILDGNAVTHLKSDVFTGGDLAWGLFVTSAQHYSRGWWSDEYITVVGAQCYRE